jgi:hypothetical protein
MVRELMVTQNYEQIERICKVLSEQFVLSQNGNFRRGGLIGIAALAIACGKVRCSFIIFSMFLSMKLSIYQGSATISAISCTTCSTMFSRQ